MIDRIGAGGMADVFRATDILLGRDVAVKVFRSVVDGPQNTLGAERQEIELRALARLGHPNLITLFDASIADSPAYLVMELVCGPSLSERIDSEGALPEPEVRVIGAQIADALGYVHAQGMVHRDVKPANILIGRDGVSGDDPVRARLSDFGIVRLLDTERLTSADLTLGTASYLAPEQARGGAVDPAADVYSLGLVLLEALTGTRAFDGPPMEAVLARLSSSPTIPDTLPRPWPDLLAAMTATEPAARPTPSEVARTLRGDSSRPVSLAALDTAAIGAVPMAAAGAAAAAEAGPPPTGVVPVDDAAGARPPRRGRLVGVLVAVVAVLLAGAGALALGGHGRGTTHGTTPTQGSTAVHRSHPATRTSSQAAIVPAQQVSSTHSTSAAARTTTHAAPPPQPTSSAAAPSTSATQAPTSAPVSSASGSTAGGAPATTAAAGAIDPVVTPTP